VKRKHKQYFVFYLKENVLIFDVFDYIEEMAADYVDYCFEWSLVKNKMVCDRTNIIDEYIHLYVIDTVIKMTNVIGDNNSKLLCYYQRKEKLNEWNKFFKNPDKFLKCAKRIFKRKMLNYFEIRDNVLLFQNVKGTFDGIPFLIPSGEDEFFLLKNLKKCKMSIDNL